MPPKVIKINTMRPRGMRTRVREDRRRSKPRMTVDTHYHTRPPKAERDAQWRRWWRNGCGMTHDGKPTGRPLCTPGCRYYGEKAARIGKAKKKIAGRRKDRRKNNRLLDE